ncbi:MAG: response regulator transcription factor [Chloroflexi bacterium]|nr:response regulator transcription factor [Chloroflexota bacterium]
MAPIRVLIVDDHPMVREGLAAILASQNDVAVAEAKNGLEAIEKAQELRPDVILMDLRMPGLNGVDAIRRIKSTDQRAKFIVLTAYENDQDIFQAIEAGAEGYLLKTVSQEELLRAVHAVAAGGSLIDPAVTQKVLERLVQLARSTGGQSPLSERELEVLRLIATGATNKEIAVALSITEGTVRTHVGNIFQKLDVKDRTEAVTKALQAGIIKL